MKTIEFAGYAWEIKDSDGKVGPGPNVFSDDGSGVYVDEEGLHLSLWQQDGVWKCSEAMLASPLGYGTYRVSVATPLSVIEKHAVFAAFLYEDDMQEIDIEVSPAMVGRGLGQFVIQPGSVQGNVLEFPVPQGAAIYEIEWKPEEVIFAVYESGSEGAIRVASERYPGPGIMSPDVARFILNLWLYRGKKAQHEQRVVISDFSFTPLP